MEEVVKQIINCETNTKFVAIYENGFIYIPEVIVYYVTNLNCTVGTGERFEDELPYVGARCCGGQNYTLTSMIEKRHLEKFISYRQEEDGDTEAYAIQELKDKILYAKKSLPYLYIDKSVEDWLKTH